MNSRRGSRVLAMGVCGTALVLWLGAVADGAPDPGCATPSARLAAVPAPVCPDLVPGRLTAEVVGGGRRLQVSDQVANNGTTDSAETTLQVMIGRMSLPPERLPAIPMKDSVQVTVSEAIPNDLRGSGQAVTLLVDYPGNAVPELEESNNIARTKVFLPTLPDLVIENAKLAVAKGGKAIDAQIAVTNKGAAADETPSTVEVAANNFSTTANVPALAMGASSTVHATLPVPQRARVGAVALTLAIDPTDLVAEQDEANNNFSPKPVTIAPDLSIVSLTQAHHGNVVSLKVNIRNAGDTRAGITEVHASAPGWKTATTRAAALATGASTNVKVSLMVPRGADGKTVPVAVSIDPVPGDPPTNNKRSVQVQIPRSPLKRPDLEVSGLRLRVTGNQLRVHGVVANVGNAAVANVRLDLLARGCERRSRALHLLASGDTMPVDLALPVPNRARGHRAAVRLQARPAPGELHLTNNAISAQVTVPPPILPPPTGHHRAQTALIGSVGGSLFAVCLSFVLVLRGRRLRLRRPWQNEAEPDRPDTCQVPQAHVLRSHCKPKPALRKIEKLELTASSGDDDERRTSLDGAIVKALNRAVWAHRLRRRRRVHQLTEPLAEQLAAEIERWLADNKQLEVAINAHVRGGKLQCTFTRSECVREEDACRWEQQQQWKSNVQHTANEPVTAVHVPLEPRAERIQQLGADLIAFVERVDTPRWTRAPQATPLLRN